MLDPIYSLFGAIFKALYEFMGSYAGAILLFTVAIKILLLPFAIKQQKNTLKQVRLKPQEALIRKRYGYDQRLMNEKLQEFYKKENFSPLGGCLPMLIQFPIIIILYRVIQNPLKYIIGLTSDEIVAKATELGVEYTAKTFSDIPVAKAMGAINFDLFGFIDLSESPSLAFNALLLIPLFAAASAFLQTFITKMSTKYTAAGDQKMPGMGLMTFSGPLISLIIAFTLPAGIGFYWTVSNLLGALQSFLLNVFMSPKKEIEKAEEELRRKVEARKAKKALENEARGEEIARKELERKNAARKAAGLKPLSSLDGDEPEDETETKDEADND